MSGLRESQHLKIPFKDIDLASKNFQTLIGRGGYGLVYKGELPISGKLTTVAVKRLNEQLGQGLKEFLTEIQLLTGQNHPNLIPLLGFCDEGKEIIVYEYAERGSLDRYVTSSNTNYSLTWLERLRVCVDAARGLDHLHNHVGKHQAIIHRDIKSANILLDENWVAKISDLGLSKLCFAGLDRSAVVSRACGTPGYCEPEYIDTGIVKKESDVYSFGMVLFEVLCGRLCSFRHRDGLLLTGRLAKDYYEKQNLDEIIDPGLREQMSLESMNKFSAIAYGCVQDDRGRRPAIDLVVKELVESLELQVEYESAKTISSRVVKHESATPQSSRVVKFDSDEEEMKLAQDSEDIIMLSPGEIYTRIEKLFSLLHPVILVDNKERIIHILSSIKEFQRLQIPLKDINLATNNFGNDHCIGQGGFGKVYKGELLLSCGLTMVAIKRLDSTFGQGAPEFWEEIQLLTGQNHPNLISLLGFCDEGKENIIVYEYAERGSLDRYLTSSNADYSLTWLERLRVCVDAARGLDHLHNHVGKHQAIIHRDIKSANILLDQNWVAKISDFGLSKLSFAGLDRSAVISHACGTPGYCEPEYIATGIVKKESDVYSFGMVLFEVLCGGLCSFRHQDGLLLSAQLARVYYEKKKLTEIIDPGLREQMSLESMNKFSAIAYRCVQEDRGHRPAMDVVVRELVGSLEIQVEYESAKPESSRVVEFDSEEMKLPQDSEDITKMLDDDAIYTNKEEPFLFDNQFDSFEVLEMKLAQDSEDITKMLNDAAIYTNKEEPFLFDNKFDSFEVREMKRLPQDSEDITKMLDDAAIYTNKEEPFLFDNKEKIIHKTPYMKEFRHLQIPLKDIILATNNFGNDHCIGQGGFGKVYKGELLLSCGLTMVAIKRLDSTLGQGAPEFWKEIMMLSRYKHENLVSLLGFCDESGESILVYEYLSNKSLDLYIRSTDLSWNQRLHICIGAARGLQYLHDPKETQQRVLHRDIKSANIMLDQNWNAKISDLGLSKMGPANQQFSFIVSNAVGTFGYCDPLYMETGYLTKESDIYSLGVVFFEVLCGRFCVENYEDDRRFLTALAQQLYKEKKLDTIISSTVREQISQVCLERFSTIAYQCLQKDRYERPTISEIVKELEIALQYQVEYEFEKEKESKRDVVLEFESVA